MSKTLIIAEKPKVANQILQLPRFNGSKREIGSKPYFGYVENKDYIVTWASGHLLEVQNPENHDPKYKRFLFEDLPIFLDLKYQPKLDTKEQLEFITKLINRNDVEHIINAADNDREGELIFREIYEYAQSNKPVSRIFKSSHEADELEAAFNALLPGSQFDSLAAAARARQYLDHLLGTTITRASTTKLANNQFLLSSGRIQMCLLAEIRKREIEVESFKESSFYNLEIDLSEGFTAELKTEKQQLNPEPLKEKGEQLVGQQLIVKSFEEKKKKKNPKNLYNLTDIYKDAITKLKANTAVVQKHIQHLYDSGYITYPRSDSRYLPTSRLEKVKEAIGQLQKNEKYEQLISNIDTNNVTEKHSVFNDEKVTAHYAIVPTSKVYNSEDRPDLEKKLYDMVVKRFLGKFLPSASYLARSIILIDERGNEFFCTEKILQSPGYLTLFKDEVEDGTKSTFKLPTLKEGQKISVKDFTIKEGKTRKPSYHNELSILSFMENAGKHIEDEDISHLLKGKRIGTTATEHTFLPKLLNRGYIESDQKGFFTCSKVGKAYIDSFPVEELKNPDFTAELEGSIEQIKDEELSYEAFIAKSKELANLIVKNMSNLSEDVTNYLMVKYNEQIEICSCLCKEGRLINKGKFYGCSCYPECKITFPKEIKGKAIPEGQIKKLIEEGKTDLIKGFKGEQGTFEAFLIAEDGNFKFKFPTAEDRSLGVCPKCNKGHIVNVKTKDKKQFYACSEFKSGCQFSIPAEVAGLKLPTVQVKKLLTKGYTDFLPGFQNKGGKEYTASLHINSDNKITFKFPTVEDRTIGKCRLCGGKVLIGKQYYLCENYKKTCEFILPGIFLEKQLTTKQAIKLLDQNMTDVIKGFKKKDGTGTFDAKLSYNTTEKRLTFIFPKKKSKQ
ncbi:type IA DNA topoisomerase [Bacillus mesophilum]|uniref:DNA topoisomerase n=1 Tax=Bacillus mesophilum TaxID=1071718 RepID=A0A7V7UTE5_9BACI|nr:type IA DNA topoisomerase [Bacillus mesophilum]KAB2329426.1 type IA DNA topoisomerase [Bacillus mesophilum]